MTRYIILLALTAVLTAMAAPSSGQETTRKVIRKVEPIPLWVNSEQLRIRDNPYAGATIGVLDRGAAIKAYGNQEHWIRISPEGRKEQWVNAKFLSGEPVNGASFKPLRRDALRAPVSNLPNDVTAPIIPETGKIHAAIVREAMDGNRIIVTKSGKGDSVWFEKRFVTCVDTGRAIDQVIAGGKTYMAMEKGTGAKAKITDETTRAAIANFACSSPQF